MRDFVPQPDAAGYEYLRLADHLAAEIAAGRLPAGSKLFGEQELARTSKVALGTVRRALAVLRDRGLITTWPGKGSFVTGPEPPSPGEQPDER